MPEIEELIKRSIHFGEQRLQQFLFPYLTTPMPAMGILRLNENALDPELIHIPKHQEVTFRLQHHECNSADFQTQMEVTIAPVSLTVCRNNNDLEFHLEHQGEQAQYNLKDLKIYIWREPANYSSSLQVQHYLRQYEEVGISFYSANEDIIGEEMKVVKVNFGLSDQSHKHPVEAIRYFFHFPEQDLYVNFDLRFPGQPTNWKKCVIRMQLPAETAQKLQINGNLFHLFTVPIANLQNRSYNPNTQNREEDRYCIIHPDSPRKFQLYSLIRVSRNGRNLHQGLYTQDPDTYEIDYDDQQRSYLILHNSTTKTQAITGEALWYQPWFNQDIATNNLGNIELKEKSWELMASMVFRHEPPLTLSDSSVLNENGRIMHFFSKLKYSLYDLKLMDLKELLGWILGTAIREDYQNIIAEIEDFEIKEETEAQTVLQITFNKMPPPSPLHLLDALLIQLANLFKSYTNIHCTLQGYFAGEQECFWKMEIP